MSSQIKKPSFGFALFSLLFIICFITAGIAFFKLQLHLLMLTGWVICALIGMRLGYTFTDLEKGAYELIQKAMGACLILICVGALIGAWNYFTRHLSCYEFNCLFPDFYFYGNFLGNHWYGRGCAYGNWRRSGL